MVNLEETIKKPADEPPVDTLVSTLAEQDTTPWYKKPNLRLLYICYSQHIRLVYDERFTAVDSWDKFYHSPRSTLLGLMSAMYSLGAIVALPLVPLVTDGLGRRNAILFGSILMVIGAIIQTASQNFAMFVMSRFVLGLGIPFAIVAASSLIGELSHPKERAILGSLFNSCYFIGSIVAAGVTLGTFSMTSNWGWRIPSLLQITPSVLQITFVYFLPESPRWLVSRDAVTKHTIFWLNITQRETSAPRNRKSWMDGIGRYPGMRKRLLIGSFIGLVTQWSGNGLTSYFLARILDNVGVHDNRTKNLINLANTCWGFLNATILALTFQSSSVEQCTCILLIFTGWTVASARYAMTESQASSRAVIAFIFLYSPAYNMAYNALTYTYLVEIFPFHVRAKGITVFQWFSRMAGFFNQFVNPIGIANAGWKYYISIPCLRSCLRVFPFPGNITSTLEELAFLYEGDEIREQKKRVEEEIKVEERTESHSNSDDVKEGPTYIEKVNA
ncbi:hypothetical protein BDQ17DRAFT_1424758 [Cyathus striatus]|nr:hypothetical protein BDQ17DRAFT_1424758 [Cyathus striatus]